MKNLKHYKFLLFTGFYLLSFNTFSASEATKQLINRTLAKYGISAGGKEICGTGREPDYNKYTGIVKCKNDSVGDDNNCWDKNSRLCKECPNGTIVSKQDHITCRQIICPEGYELVDLNTKKCPEGYEFIEVVNNKCPDDFEIKEFSENNCGDGMYYFDEIQATNNYTTQSINCKNIN